MNDYLKGILKANKINPDDVQDVDGDMLVTFKDGTQRRICEVWTRRPNMRVLKNSSKRGNTL